MAEESVTWVSENQIEFKVILRELNTERKRYLVLNIKERLIQLLRSTNRDVEINVKFSDISNIERSIQDHRQVMLKRSSIQNVYLITFSSVYKVL